MSAQGDGMSGRGAASELYQNVTCPFCGLLCDDLEIARTGSALKVLKNGCPRSAAGFQRAASGGAADGRGQGGRAQGGHRRRRRPHQGRQAAALWRHGHRRRRRARRDVARRPRVRRRRPRAERGPVPQPARSLQTSGWIMSTLTETRNRADLIVIVGSDVHKLHGRFFERIVCAPKSMFEDVRKAHGRVHRRGARYLGGQGPAHRRGHHSCPAPTRG